MRHVVHLGNRISEMPKQPARPRRRASPPRRRASRTTQPTALLDTGRLLNLDHRLYAYLIGETVREPEVMARLRAETRRMPDASLQIGPEQAQLMGLLCISSERAARSRSAPSRAIARSRSRSRFLPTAR